MANTDEKSRGFKMKRPIRTCRCPAVEPCTRGDNNRVHDTRARLIDYPASQFARANPDLSESQERCQRNTYEAINQAPPQISRIMVCFGASGWSSVARFVNWVLCAISQSLPTSVAASIIKQRLFP